MTTSRAPVTTGLGVLGMPGFTAYGGLRMIGKTQPEESVVVAAASGPIRAM
jgi:NADPH-dependent curcumin reductase